MILPWWECFTFCHQVPRGQTTMNLVPRFCRGGLVLPGYAAQIPVIMVAVPRRRMWSITGEAYWENAVVSDYCTANTLAWYIVSAFFAEDSPGKQIVFVPVARHIYIYTGCRYCTINTTKLLYCTSVWILVPNCSGFDAAACKYQIVHYRTVFLSTSSYAYLWNRFS